MSSRTHFIFSASDIAQHCLWFDLEGNDELDSAAERIALPPQLDGAVHKRRREFLAGRICAREAIRALMPERAAEPVGIGPNREPLWPSGLVGALTHAHGFAAAAVGRAADYRGIGIDSERLISPATATSIVGLISVPGELDAIGSAAALSPAAALTLLFSAKESIFKCLHPLVRRYFDFLEARIETVDLETGSFRARLLATLTPELIMDTTLDGRFRLEGDWIHTGMLLRVL
jgi:enterobactin synthetase component D